MKKNILKWTTFSVLLGVVATTPILVYAVKNRDIKDYEFEADSQILDESKIFNFDNQVKYRHTFGTVKEVLRLSLASTTKGWMDFSTTPWASSFKDPKHAYVPEVVSLLYDSKITKNNINELIHHIQNNKFYYEFGREVFYNVNSAHDEKRIHKKINNYIKFGEYMNGLNSKYLDNVSGHMKSNPVEFTNKYLSIGSFEINNKIKSINEWIQEWKDHKIHVKDAFNKIKNKKILLSYKMPKWLIQEYDPQDDVVDELEGIVNSPGNVYTVKPEYEPEVILKRMHDFGLADYSFVNNHQHAYSYEPDVSAYTLMKRLPKNRRNYKNKIYDQYGYERFAKGKSWNKDWSFWRILNYTEGWSNSVYESTFKTQIPLKKTFFNDKLHESQSSEYGILALYNSDDHGHSASEWDARNKWGNAKTWKWPLDLALDDLYNWQYMRRVGIFNHAMNGADPRFSNEAHKNGVKSLGAISMNDINRFRFMLKKDRDGTFPFVDKLIKIAKDYGYDGWWFNIEPNKTITADFANDLREAFKYLRKRFNEEHLQVEHYAWRWGEKRGHEESAKSGEIYKPFNGNSFEGTSLTKDGLYQFAFDKNGNPLTTPEYMPGAGSIHPFINPRFNTTLGAVSGVNYNSYSIQNRFTEFKSDIAYQTMLKDKFRNTKYGGVAYQAWSGNSPFLSHYWWDQIYRIQMEARKNPDYKFSPQGRLDKEYVGDTEYFSYGGAAGAEIPQIIKYRKIEKNNMFRYSTISASDSKDPRSYFGSSHVAKYYQESSVIDDSNSFSTSFSLATSKARYIEGKKMKLFPFRNGELADILPTYKFIIDKYDSAGNLVDWKKDNYRKNTLRGIFQDKDVYSGGAAVSTIGTLANREEMDMRLYSVKYSDQNTSEYTFTYKGDVIPKMLVWDSWNGKTKIDATSSKDLGNGWKKVTFPPTTSTDVKYIGVNFRNGTGKDLDMTTVSLDRLQRKKIGSVVKNPFPAQKLRAEENYDFVSQKSTYLLDLGLKYNEDVTYKIYSSDINFDYVERNLMSYSKIAIANIDPKEGDFKFFADGNKVYTHLTVVAVDNEDRILGTQNIKFFIRKHHTLLYKGENNV